MRRLRKALYLTQEKFAQQAGIEPRHYQDIEGGKVDVGCKMLEKIRRALGCDWNTMMAGTDTDGAAVMELRAANAVA